MSHKNNNQKGFGVVEVLLIIAAVALLGFVGWYVYDANIKANESLDGAQKVNDQTQQEQPKQMPKAYLKITELGVQLETVTVKELTYLHQKDSAGHDVAVLYTDALSKYCDPHAADAPLGTLFKIPGKYKAEPGGYPSLLKQYDDFYIAYRAPQQSCTNDKAGMDLQNQQQSQVDKILQTVQMVQ